MFLFIPSTFQDRETSGRQRSDWLLVAVMTVEGNDEELSVVENDEAGGCRNLGSDEEDGVVEDQDISVG